MRIKLNYTQLISVLMKKKNALEGKAEILHFLGIDVLLPLVHTHLFLLKSSLL